MADPLIEKGTSPGVPGGARAIRPEAAWDAPLRPEETAAFKAVLGGAGQAAAQKRPAPLVLVADDHPLDRQAVIETLKELRSGYMEAGDGAAALQGVAKESPDILVVDVMMPVLDGYQVMRAVRGHLNNKKILILAVGSGGTMEEQIWALSVGADDYLPKPLRRILLKARLKALLRRTIP